MANKTKLFAKNSLFSALQQVFIFVSGLIVPNIMLRFYGSEINGAVSSVTQLVSYVSLIEAGMSGSIIYFLYKPLYDKDYKKINSIISATKLSYRNLGFIFVALSTIVAIINAFTLKVSGLNKVEMFLLTFSIGFSGALEYFTLSKYRVLFTADQRNYIISIANILHTLIHIVVVVICAFCGFGVVVLKIVSICSVFVRSLLLHLYLKNQYKWANFKEEPDYSALEKRWDAFYMQVLWALQSGAPIIIATYLTNMISVSIYTIYNLVITGINNIVSIFMTGLQAAFGEILVRKDEEKLNSVYKQFSFVFYGIISVVYSIAGVMLMPFIMVYTSDISDSFLYCDMFLGILFIINGLLYSFKTPQGMMVIAAGHYKETRIQTTVQALILIIFGVVFAGPLNLGLKGIVFACIISNGYRVIDLVCYVDKQIVNGSIYYTIKNLVFSLLHIVIIYCIFSAYPINSNGYLMWIFDALKVSAISVGVLLLRWFVFERTSVKELFQRIKIIFKRKR